MAFSMKAALCAAALACAGEAQAATYYQFEFFTEGFGITTRSVANEITSRSGFNNATITTYLSTGSPFTPTSGGIYLGGGTAQSFVASASGLSFVDIRQLGRGADDRFAAAACFDNSGQGTAPVVGSFVSTPGCGSAEISVSDNGALSATRSTYTGSVRGLRISVVDLDQFPDLTTFVGTVPEPSTWALMLAGFGLTGYALRRRRSRVAFA